MANFNDDRIRAMLAGRRSVQRVPFPGLGLDAPMVGIRLMRDSEMDAARLQASRDCKTAGVDLEVDPEALDRLTERQIIWRSFVDPECGDDDPPPYFPSYRDVASLDAVLVRSLFRAYLEVQDFISPRGSLSDAEVQELVDALGKEPGATVLLDRFAHETLQHCVRSLASRLRVTSPTSKFSDGSRS